MAIYTVHNWPKTLEEKWFENTDLKLRSNNNSPHSQNKLPSELEMENEVFSSCKPKDFYNNITTHSPKKFVVSAWLDVLVGQSWECCLTPKPCISSPPFKVFVIPNIYWHSDKQQHPQFFSTDTDTSHSLSYLYNIKNIFISLLCKKENVCYHWDQYQEQSEKKMPKRRLVGLELKIRNYNSDWMILKSCWLLIQGYGWSHEIIWRVFLVCMVYIHIFYILIVTLYILSLQAIQYVSYVQILSNHYLGRMNILVLFNLHPTLKSFFHFLHFNLNTVFSISYSNWSHQ